MVVEQNNELSTNNHRLCSTSFVPMPRANTVSKQECGNGWTLTWTWNKP